MMVKTKLVYTYEPGKFVLIKNEKSSYKYVSKVLFSLAYKFYSPVLRGLPDYIVIKTKIDTLKPGFYEVKFENRPLTREQEKLMSMLAQAFSVYLVRVYKTGRLEVYEVF